MKGPVQIQLGTLMMFLYLHLGTGTYTLMVPLMFLGVFCKELPKKEMKKLEEKRVNQWRKEEGEKVAMFLGQKSLLNTSTAKGSFAGLVQYCNLFFFTFVI